MSAAVSNLQLVSCLLFTPGTRPERFAKTADSGADGIIIDLEDAVAAADKDAARQTVIAYLQQHGAVLAARPFVTALRLNGLRTTAGLKDVVALAEAHVCPDVVVLPKVESPIEVEIVAAQLQAARADVQCIALIETARGLDCAQEIAAADAPLGALAFGGVDLAADLGATFEWEPLLWARSRLVQAAATAGIATLDAPYLDLQDLSGLEPECQRARRLGFTGKLAIHPRHVPAIMSAFEPDAASVARAQRIVDAYDAAQGGVCEVDGKMIDVPVYRAALRTLARARRG